MEEEYEVSLIKFKGGKWFMNIKQRFLGITRKVILSILAIVAMSPVVFSKNGVAHADIPQGTIRGFMFTVSDLSGPFAGSQYTNLIQSIRETVGHPYRGNTYETQQIPTVTVGNRTVEDHYQRGLLRVTLRLDGQTYLHLWVTPGNLYLRGFTNSYGETFQFNDGDYSLLYHLGQVGGNTPGGGQTLPFGSNYNSLNQHAGRTRYEMPVSYNDFLGSARQLSTERYPYGGGASQQNTARSLMFFTQWLSEAVRFHDVRGVMTDVMYNNSFYNGMPIWQVNLENDWGQMSRYGYQVSTDPYNTAPHNVTGVDTLYNWDRLASFMSTMLNHNSIATRNGRDYSEL